MSEPLLKTADEVDAGALHGFLARFFGRAKADFLARHGAWWHGGQENRLLLEVEGTLAAYCSVMPARTTIDGEARDGLWWTDLIVAPEFRGRGLQTIFDREVRARSDLLLGFPNELAARIHRKHGWGVREDMYALLAPLRPHRLNAVLRRGRAVRLAAYALLPFAALLRREIERAGPGEARRVDEPDLERWAALARHSARGRSTTLRDEAYLRHRFLDAPYRDELLFYESPSLAILTRRLVRQGRSEERLLDVFGELDRREELRRLLRYALAEASRAGAAQMTAIAGDAELGARFQKSGFLLRTTARLCWWSDDPELLRAFGQARQHWSLADSDNDDPAG